MTLEAHDELGLPWDEWADGRVRRLVKGRDFLRSAEAVKEAAENAAHRLGKVAVTVKESRPGNVFVWVQFVEHQILAGAPCPCGGTNLRRINRLFAECGSCGSTVLIVEPRRKPAVDDGGTARAGDALLHSLLDGTQVSRASEADAPGRAGTKRKSRDPRTDPRRFGPFREIVLCHHERFSGRERYFGKAHGPGGRDWLLVVDFPLAQGEWMRSDEAPGGWAHAVWAVPVEPFRDIVDLGKLAALKPDLQINDPFVDDYSDRPQAPDSATAPIGRRPPPTSVTDLLDVTLFQHARHTDEVERYLGYGRMPDGELLLITLRFRLDDGRRRDDPQNPGRPVHDLQCMPVAPFWGIVDPAPLIARQPDLRLDDSLAARLSGDDPAPEPD
jgi:hypothetical protein